MMTHKTAVTSSSLVLEQLGIQPTTLVTNCQRY